MKNYRFIRFIEFGDLFELFFPSAILTILAIRIYLRFTGFPQIGSGEFHIAHLLFGGFFMLAAIIGFMTFLNNDLKSVWTILGGIGFGTFIDEVGKFVTRDNNYFFQPTFAIIYVIFVLIYLIYKSIEHSQKFTKEEYLINSINSLEDFELKHFDKEEKEEALSYLKLADQNNPLTHQLIKIFSENKEQSPNKLSFFENVQKKVITSYRFFLKKTWFTWVISSIFIVRSVIYLINGIILIQNIYKHFFDRTLSIFLNPGGALQLVKFLALVAQAVFTIVGAVKITQSRKSAYAYFRNALLVSVFILQVFNFYNNPLRAMFSTAGDLLLLAAVTSMRRMEK